MFEVFFKENKSWKTECQPQQKLIFKLLFFEVTLRLSSPCGNESKAFARPFGEHYLPNSRLNDYFLQNF